MAISSPFVEAWHRLRFCVAALVGVIVAGTVGYIILGFPWLDALYQTVPTVATVGFREVQPLSAVGQAFTIALILVGVGTALYTFTQVRWPGSGRRWSRSRSDPHRHRYGGPTQGAGRRRPPLNYRSD